MRLALLLFSRYYSVSNAIFKPTCIAIQVALPVLQYTSFLVDDCFSIRPGNSCLFPAALAVQREKYQRCILIDLCACIGSTGRTLYPLGMSFFFLHHGTFFIMLTAHHMFNHRVESFQEISQSYSGFLNATLIRHLTSFHVYTLGNTLLLRLVSL